MAGNYERLVDTLRIHDRKPPADFVIVALPGSGTEIALRLPYMVVDVKHEHRFLLCVLFCFTVTGAFYFTGGTCCLNPIDNLDGLSIGFLKAIPHICPVGKLGNLHGVRVVEIGDEQAEYAGLLLAGMGAEVIKIEPPGGSPSRSMPPFYRDEPDVNTSLQFWAYNRGKRSVVLDPQSAAGLSALQTLAERADIVLTSAKPGLRQATDIDCQAMMRNLPSLVVARMTPFGDNGPWAKFVASDLVHLALGGVAANCGYDPDPSGTFDLPPIAPQFWHSYHIAGDQLAGGIVAALIYRNRSGHGQYVSCAVHEAVSKNTELDVPSWVMRRLPFYRQTCQHAAEIAYRIPCIAATKDGRWMMTRWSDDVALRKFLDSYGMAGDLEKHESPPPGVAETAQSLGRAIPGIPIDGRLADLQAHRMAVVARFVGAFTYENFPWREAQDAGLIFAPLRKPHENAAEGHWMDRGTFADVPHPELGRSFRYPVSRWRSSATTWLTGRRAPLLGEDTAAVLGMRLDRWAPQAATITGQQAETRSPRGKPFALDDVRILDFSWFLASAGATRILSAYGAQVIKVEWREHPDTRFGAQAPVGGRAARDSATAPLPGVLDPDMGGQFNNKNPGKRGISLNVRHPEGLALAKRLVAISDIVAEGFSPGVMDRWGLGYDGLRAIRPDIIYAQQSGTGQYGSYGRVKVVGPIAQSLTGANEMSGIPEPAAPAGWGYSYLDWIGAYSFANAMLSALYYREQTRQGQWIDASQCEAGIFLNGVAILDWSANGRVWQRHGNRHAYRHAAPHGLYPCRGTDRWVAISCGDQQQWRALARAAGHPEWCDEPRFADLARRLENQDALDRVIAEWTAKRDAYAVMDRLQSVGVPAGVSQTAEDRCDRDPQLESLDWLTEVTGTKIGRWPIADLPVRMSDTPPYIGGRLDRGAPCYGEDNEYVFGELLGLPARKIAELAEEGAI